MTGAELLALADKLDACYRVFDFTRVRENTDLTVNQLADVPQVILERRREALIFDVCFEPGRTPP